MKKNSTMTPFIAREIKKMKETGITNFLTKRYIIPEPNCKSICRKGKSLGMDKFASLFLFYSICCIFSLITFVMENIFKPTNTPWTKNIPEKSVVLSKKIDALAEELKLFGSSNAIKLLNEIRDLSI